MVVPLTQFILTPDAFLLLGLEMAGFDEQRRARRSMHSLIDSFTKWYGSNHIVVAKIWEDLLTTDNPQARIDKSMVNVEGFLISLHFLRKYPTEDDQEGIFGVCKKTARKWSWYYAGKIQALKTEKIIWPDRWSQPMEPHDDASEIIIISVDGVHCRINEPVHPEYPKNHKMYSHKFKTAGLNYEVALSLWENKVVWINGPFQASDNDLIIFRRGLKNKIPDGRFGIADGGYKGEEKLILSSRFDTEELRRFKSRAKARQESFNKRLKQFSCLSDRFRHDWKAKHKICFEAVCVIGQYQLENGFELFDI